jgi:electron transfer flavoprotein beta subunit
MHIVVPIKQVPETDQVRMDPETGTMIRRGLSAIINPLDLYALETALHIKETRDAHITVITMGPRLAEKALQEAVSLGCDRAVLITDRKFAGSDTWATAYVLSQAVRKLAPVDLVICGERATDGDTGQVGPGIASFLDLPLATYVDRLIAFEANGLRLRRMVENGSERLWTQLPAVLTVVKDIASPRFPTLDSKLAARHAPVTTWGAPDLDVDEAQIGLRGSPTRVVKIEKSKLSRKGEVQHAFTPEGINTAANRILAFLKDRHFVD